MLKVRKTAKKSRNIRLLYKANRAFIRGETKELTHRDEVLEYLSGIIGARRGSKRHILIKTLVLGASAIVSTIFVIAYMNWFNAPHAIAQNPMLICLAIIPVLSGLLLILIPYFFVDRFYRYLRYSDTDVNEVYTRLIQEGKIVKGKIATIYPYGDTGRGQIHYRFRKPSDKKIIDGYMVTSSNSIFRTKKSVIYKKAFYPAQHGYIIVLYLNDRIHVPL